MRRILLSVPVCLVLAHGGTAVAQQMAPGDLFNMFGKMMNAAGADAQRQQANDAWTAADPALVACLQQRYAINPQFMASRGIGPYDPRLRPQLIQCNQSLVEQKKRNTESAEDRRQAAQDAWARIDPSAVACFDSGHSPTSQQLADQGVGPRDRPAAATVDRCVRKLANDRDAVARKKVERDAEIAKKKTEEAERRAAAEQRAVEAKQKKLEAEKLAADARQRDAQKSKIISSPKLAFLGDGASDDLVAIVNIGERAPHAVVDLHGRLTFTDNAAILCMPIGTALSPIEARLYKEHLAAMNVTETKIETVHCDNLMALASIDLLVLRRANIFQGSVSDVGALISGVNGDQFIKGFVITKDDVKATEDKREVEMTTLKNGIEKATRKGYGVIVVPNNGQLFCNTAVELAKIFPDLSHELMTPRDFEKIDPTKLQAADVDTDTAFISIKKDRCRAVFGNADSLRTLMAGLDRDHIEYALDGRWISDETVAAYEQGKSQQERRRLQEEAEVKQRLAADAELMERRAEATGKVRAEKQQALRAANGARVASLKEQYLKDTETFVHAASDKITSTTLGRLYPELAQFYGNRLTEGWEFESYTVDVRDYGTTTWKGRALEAFLVTSTINILNRELGERRHICYVAGYIDDVEFGMFRSPKFVMCNGSDTKMEQWKASVDFTSKWNAE